MAKREEVAAELEAAAAHARERAWAEASAQLIAAWRKAPSGRIAELLIAIEAPLPPPAPIEGTTVAEREARWHVLAAKPDDANLARLLAAPWPVHPKGAKLRIIALEAWPPSPRIATALLDLLRRGRYRSSAGRVVTRRAAQHLFTLKDPAISQYLDALEQETGLGAQEERGELVAVLKRRRPAEPAWTAREGAALDALAALTASTATTMPSDRLPELEAAVFAAPDDDGPRHVLADYLIERADPRGELISLQLARHANGRAPTPRERALLRDAGRTWVEALEADGAKVDAFSRGFPSAAHMHGDTFTTPAWATIETLEWFPLHRPFRGSPHLRGLRSLQGIVAGSLAGLTLERELDRLWLRDVLTSSALRDPTVAAPRILDIDYEADPGWRARLRELLARVFDWPVGRRLREINLRVTATMLEFLAQVLDETPKLDAIATDHRPGPYGGGYWGSSYWSARVTRDAMELAWNEKYTEAPFAALADILGSMKPRTLSRLAITTRSPVPKAEAAKLRMRVAAVLDRWPAIADRSLLES